jgi:hypothetical protein
METKTRKNGYTVIHCSKPSPREYFENMGRAMRTRERLEAEREKENKRPLTKAEKIRFDKTVEKFNIDMQVYLDNISYK